MSFHHRGMQCKSRKSIDNQSNRQIWPWSTKRSRAKASRVLPREHGAHRRHTIPTTQETSLHMDIKKWSRVKSDWLNALQPKMFSSVQSLSRVWLFATPWTAAHQASVSITNSWSLLKLMSIESVRPSNHIILCHPLLLPSSIFPSIRVFSNESVLHIRWPKYWSFSFSISLFNECSRLISFRMDWFDLLAVQRALRSLPQHHS